MSTSAPQPAPLSGGSLSRSWENGVGWTARRPAAEWAATFKDFPPVQRPNTFTLDDELRMMHETAAAMH